MQWKWEENQYVNKTNYNEYIFGINGLEYFFYNITFGYFETFYMKVSKYFCTQA